MSVAPDLATGGQVRVERLLPLPPEDVWRQLAEPALRAGWLGRGRLELHEGGEVRLHLRDAEGRVHVWTGEVERCEPGRLLLLRWSTEGGSPSRVRLELGPAEGGTRLVVTEERNEPGTGGWPAPAWGAALTALGSRLLPAASPAGGPAATARPAAHFHHTATPGQHPPIFGSWKTLGVVALLIGAGAGTISYLWWKGEGPGRSGSVCGGGYPTFRAEPTPPGGAAWQGWQNATCLPWTSGGVPVVFFAASVECPYCDASTWPLYLALQNFSVHLPLTFNTSLRSDVYPGTAGVGMTGGPASSAYLAWDPGVDLNTGAVGVPTLGSPASGYETAYDSAGAIPFLLVGGAYAVVGALESPGCLSLQGCNATASGGTTPLTPTEVWQNQSSGPDGALLHAVRVAQVYLEAYFVKADQLAGVAPPPTVASNAWVMSVVGSIR